MSTDAGAGIVGLNVLAVDGHFEEIEGKDQEERCSDPVKTHHYEQPFLVRTECYRPLSYIPETFILLFIDHQLL